jgi:hypothetical protein
VQTITDIPSVLDMIRQEKYKAEILDARQYGKGHETFEQIKKTIPTFSPNGTFHQTRAQKNIQTLSGMVYLDIDRPVEPIIFHQIPWIYSCWKSFGGIGYGLLACVSGLSKDNFNSTWIYLSEFFNMINIQVDKHSKDISRQCVISYDPDIYINPSCIPLVVRKNNINPIAFSPTSKYSNSTDKSIPDNYQIKIKYQTTLKEYNDQDFIIIPDGKEYRDSYLPKMIPDGERHKWISSFTSTILFNNPAISNDRLRQVVQKANRDHCKPELTTMEINSIVNWSFNNHTHNQLNIKTKKKKIWINPDKKFSKKEKQSIIGKQTGIIRKNNTIQSLIRIYITLRKQNPKVTQKLLQQHSTKSLRTIKKYWKEINEGVLCN